MKETLIASLGEWRDLRKTKRLFAPLNCYDPTQCHWTHAMRISGEPDGDGPYESVAADVLNACAAWQKLGTFAERNARKERKCSPTPSTSTKSQPESSLIAKATAQPSELRTDGVTTGVQAPKSPISPLASERKPCSNCGTMVYPHEGHSPCNPAHVSESPKTSISTSPAVPSATTTAFANAYGLVSPLASDGPESRGWVRLSKQNHGESWTREEFHLIRTFDKWYAFKGGRILQCDGTLQFAIHYFSDWQIPDALLFPAHEWAVGDEVECLDEKDFGTCFAIEATSIIKSIAKHPFWNSDGDNLCAIFAGGRHHPISALRLIKAAERKA